MRSGTCLGCVTSSECPHVEWVQALAERSVKIVDRLSANCAEATSVRGGGYGRPRDRREIDRGDESACVSANDRDGRRRPCRRRVSSQPSTAGWSGRCNGVPTQGLRSQSEVWRNLTLRHPQRPCPLRCASIRHRFQYG